MGIKIAEYILFILCSFGLAVLAAYYKWYYTKKKRNAMKEVLSKSKVFFPLCVCFYITAAVLGLVFYEGKGLSFIELIQNLLIWDTFFLIAVIDYRLKKIPNHLIVFLLIARVVIMLTEIFLAPDLWVSILISSIAGMLAGGLIILACMLISRGGVGAGDVKLYAVTGFCFGLTGVMAVMMYSLFLAAIASIVLLISRKAKMKSSLPMAPFIFAGLSVYFIFL